MGFYEAISRVYERLFPAGEAQVNFLLDALEAAPSKQVLDVACGTGAYSRALARTGFAVTGIDLDAAMIDQARVKAQADGLSIAFETGDMRDLSAFGDYGGVICLGNSIPHLLSAGEIQLALGQMQAALAPGGVIVLQVVNFDRMLAKKLPSLPEIRDTEGTLRFRRFYDYRADGLIDFRTELILRTNGSEQVFHNTVPLRPILAEELKTWLESLGFDQIEVWGGFDRSPHGPDRAATVVEARKRRRSGNRGSAMGSRPLPPPPAAPGD